MNRCMVCGSRLIRHEYRRRRICCDCGNAWRIPLRPGGSVAQETGLTALIVGVVFACLVAACATAPPVTPPTQAARWHPQLADDVLQLLVNDNGAVYWVIYQRQRRVDDIRRALEHIRDGAECRRADINCDGDVDLGDFGVFQEEMAP